MNESRSLPPGQQRARTRWNTHTSGVAFDRKKVAYLSNQAQTFIAQQAFCVLAGSEAKEELSGLIASGRPGFVQTPDAYTCVLELDEHLTGTRFVQELYHSSEAGQSTPVGLFFISHPTRERLCVQGVAQVFSHYVLDGQQGPQFRCLLYVCVRQAFFHCPKYIHTHIAGLTCVKTASAVVRISYQECQLQNLEGRRCAFLSEAVRDFIARQTLCFICTIDRQGHCAVNHRGGARGFLVTLPPDSILPGGTIVLPDYAGNGAFEAIGNILETGQVTLVIPDYTMHLALSIGGVANVVELNALSPDLACRCPGAERVVALAVQRVEVQRGDWKVPLAYERARASTIAMQRKQDVVCRV
ncbi:MAG: pyridoxamine 5'-phosphate oxidase family protein [Ktedonobacteraceae bacterium]|nr:pyridoxamine 5'-phosphate oxidase family protein [Ktedonobacteraceae bacterium]